MTEMLPEKPRLWTPADCRIAASKARLGGHSDVGEALDLIASAWEADRYAIKGLEYDRKRLGEDVCYLRARIDALENRRKGLIAEIEVYRKQLARIRDRTTDPWAQQVARDGLHQGEVAALAAEEKT